MQFNIKYIIESKRTSDNWVQICYTEHKDRANIFMDAIFAKPGEQLRLKEVIIETHGNTETITSTILRTKEDNE